MFSPPKTLGVHIWWGWALSQSWSGTSHDPILPGRLPEPLLTLPSQALQKSSESAGCSHGLPGRYPTLLQKRLTLKSETGTLPLGTHTTSQSEELLTGCSPMERYLFSWGPSLLQWLSDLGATKTKVATVMVVKIKIISEPCLCPCDFGSAMDLPLQDGGQHITTACRYYHGLQFSKAGFFFKYCTHLFSSS